MSSDDAGTGSTASIGDVPVAGTGEVKLDIEGVRKQFGRVVALDGVDLDIYENEIFALVGDNGAGKSTLMNIISGVYPATEGSIKLDGVPVNFSNPSDARATGIETVYQDLALMDDLDIATNVFMGQFPLRFVGPWIGDDGRGWLPFTQRRIPAPGLRRLSLPVVNRPSQTRFVDWDETYERAAEIVHDQLGRTEIDLRTEVQFLSGGQRQLVAIARTLAFDPHLIILDEPTSALSVDASRLVHRTIDRLQEEGMTVLVVSHNIEDVIRIADRIGVLYQGELVEITTPDETDLETLTNLMTTGSRRDS